MALSYPEPPITATPESAIAYQVQRAAVDTLAKSNQITEWENGQYVTHSEYDWETIYQQRSVDMSEMNIATNLGMSFEQYRTAQKQKNEQIPAKQSENTAALSKISIIPLANSNYTIFAVCAVALLAFFAYSAGRR
jgi:uncharacterized protein YqfA (UPF0365 family)